MSTIINGWKRALVLAALIGTAGAAQAQSFEVLHIFTNAASGAVAPNQPLIANGVIYGSTFGDGAFDDGNVFSMNLDGTGFTNLHSFDLTDGQGPGVQLILAGATLYGTTTYGGPSKNGTVYSINTDGTGFTVLHDFSFVSAGTGTNADGAEPYTAVTLLGSNLYGTTGLGGASSNGVIFSIGTNGSGFTVLHNFSETSSAGVNADGADCAADLTAAGGVLYGATAYGGSNGNGVVFSINPDGTGFTVLHAFSGVAGNAQTNADGANPFGDLTIIGSTLYGSAFQGGRWGYGVIFSMSTNGSGFTNLHSFDGTNGAAPQTGLVLVSNLFYGTTFGLGDYTNGTVFAIGTNGTGFTTLHYFANLADGSQPYFGIAVTNDVIYGTTDYGGADDNGNVYALTIAPPPTGTITVLTNGNGSVAEDINGLTLPVGKKITLKAVPAPGNLFAGWLGLANTSANPVTVTVEAGAVLQANFTSNIFLVYGGAYNGLFFPSSGVSVNNSGMLKNFVVSSKGTYSGSLILGGAAHALSGTFSAFGNAGQTITLPRAQGGSTLLTLSLSTVSNLGPFLTGTLSNASWNASLYAAYAPNSFPHGQYTALVPADSNNAPPTSSPAGYSYLLISDSGAGKNPAAAVSGALADGTTVAETAPVSAAGLLPFYASLYGGKGMALGWIDLSTNNNSSFIWIRPAKSGAAYPSGFMNTVLGSAILTSPWTNAPASFDFFTNLVLPSGTTPISISSAGKITGTGVAGSINPKTGAWTLTSGKGASAIDAHGAIAPSQALGGGYYLTKTAGQSAVLIP